MDIGCAPCAAAPEQYPFGRLLGTREYSEGAHPRSYPEGIPARSCVIDAVPRWYNYRSRVAAVDTHAARLCCNVLCWVAT